jgi:hypothetical protein
MKQKINHSVEFTIIYKNKINQLITILRIHVRTITRTDKPFYFYNRDIIKKSMLSIPCMNDITKRPNMSALFTALIKPFLIQG